MPLTNFGAILNFAEVVEKNDLAFYAKAQSLDAAESYRIVFEMFAKESKKSVSMIQRTRRENVTEMILEPIRDFVRSSYTADFPVADDLDLAGMLETAIAIETRAVRYYTDASVKIRALPEVARALTTLAKKRTKRIDQLQRLASA